MLSMKKHVGFIAMVLIVMIDLWTKHLVASNLRLYEAIEIIPNFFWITYVLNTGAAWSMFNNFTWLLTLISAVATVGLSYVYWTKKHNVLVSLGLVLMMKNWVKVVKNQKNSWLIIQKFLIQWKHLLEKN